MATQNLNPGKWHVCFSWNMERGRAGWVRAVNLAAKIRERLSAVTGVALDDPPDTHNNPEPTRREVSFTSRDVWSVDVWIDVRLRINSAMLDSAATLALRDAGAGTDWDTMRVTEAMGRGVQPLLGGQVSASGVGTAAARAALGVWQGFGPEFLFGVVSSSYEPFSGTAPQPAMIDGAVGRLAAGPVTDSNNPARIGQSDPVFTLPVIDLGVSPLAIKVTLGVVGGLAALVIIGYTARGVSGLIREVK